MLIIDTTVTLQVLLSERLRHVLALRSELIDFAAFIIVDPGDSKEAIEAAVGFPIDRDFPPWEWVVRHDGIFEAPIVTSDEGDATVLLVPDDDGIVPELLTMLRDDADPVETVEALPS
ncbi:hypothetical protein [Sphingomonas sp. IC4-52]|uniref:hypothetical protein n=1 Tax=Sphingomonas sp. IC4-52 TaxID=2887202 RepID=UPI001D10F96C|nr:hypothetical protein [Sphingomonas sp. IC4-52]MCC2980050.1 hypothetical protein [Sphingomonas sp. IC4-52]